MDRRGFLHVTSITFGGVLASGCTAEEESTATPTEVPEAKAERRIDGAKEEIDDAIVELDAEIDRFDAAADPVDFRTDRIFGHLDAAESELDGAEDDASDDQRADVETLRATIDWLRALTETYGHFGAALDGLDTALAYWDSERYDDAEDELTIALDDLDDAQAQLTVAENELEDVDESALESFDRIDHTDAVRNMDELNELVDAMTVFVDGYRDLTRGMNPLWDGFTAYDDGGFDVASDRFGEARDHYASAHATFQDGEDIAPTELRADFIEATCLAGAFRDAATHFEDSADAAVRGDEETATEEWESGERAFDRCE